MGNCIKCNGNLKDQFGKFGDYWKCSKCGYTLSKRCICGGKRELITFGGKSVAKCTTCRKYRY
jgi:hypothetical protein